MVKKVIPDTVFAVPGLLGSPPVLFIQKLIEMSHHSSLSFPFYFPRKAFFTARLSGCPHELTLAFLSDQGLTFGSDDFFDWP